MTQQNIKRRSLVKGAAWAAPALATSALVPAYASSVCPDSALGPNRTTESGGFGSRGTNTYFVMYAAGPGDIILNGIPEDVTVDRVDVSLIFRTRFVDSNNHVQGLPPLNQSNLTAAQATTGTPTGPNYYIGKNQNADYNRRDVAANWTRLAPSTSSVTTTDYWDFTKGGVAQATITRGLNIVHPDGGTYDSWKIDFPTWLSDDPNEYRIQKYETDSLTPGCQRFTLSNFGNMAFYYKNAQAPFYYESGVNEDGTKIYDQYLNVFIRTTYQLSNGRTVVLDSWRTSSAPEWPSEEWRITIN